MNKQATLPLRASPASSVLLASTRLCLAFACGATLLAHAAFALNLAVAIGLASCAAFAWVQVRSFQLNRLALLRKNAAQPAPAPPQIYALLPTLLGALAIGVVAWQHQTVLGKEAGLACLTVLAAFKLWECRQSRDVQVLVGLLFFLQLGIFLREESLAALITVLVCATLTLSAWIFFTAQHPASVWQTAHSMRKVILAPLKETLRLAALGLPLAALLFFVFPRIAGPLWGLPQDATSSRIGLSNSLEPGRFAQLAASDALALRAKFEGALPPPQALYWRGPVLSQFDGLVWRPIDTALRLQASASALAAANNYRYTVVAEPHKLSLRVLLDTPLASTGGIELTPQASPIGAAMLERETVQAVSATQLRWGAPREANASQTALPSAQQRLALQSELDLPAGANPRALAYAAELRRALGDNETDPTPFIKAILNQYRSTFTYTLSPPTPKGRKEDAVDGFFFDTQTGYCEHFAASFVVLMRALDFPARIVTGYQGGELNPQDGWLVVKQSDAHAWAEVLHPTQGWQRIDPTAAVAPWRVEAGGAALQSTAGQPATGLGGLGKATREALLPLRQWAEATARVWQDYGLNYGKDRQKELFKRFGFPDVDAVSIATVLGTALAAWLLLAAWVHRSRQLERSPHAKALAEFDALCRSSVATKLRHLLGFRNGPLLPPPRAPSQTPQTWFLLNAHHLQPAQVQRLKLALLAYEQRCFAPVK